MSTLLLRLAGPMQSWGTTSRFDERDSQLEPSKSGVLGLVCAALGRDRSEPVDDLARLKMGVRVDREGLFMRDYQTATGVISAAGQVDLGRTVVSPRYYLADAAFLVGLEDSDRGLLMKIHAALRTPIWPLALGRKSFPPGAPVWLGVNPVEYHGPHLSPHNDVLVCAGLVRDIHAKYLAANRNAKVALQGHADERGSREYNIALGQKRSDAVKRMMTLLGVQEAIVETVSFGEEKPKNPGHDEASWAENRRVDIFYAGE